MAGYPGPIGVAWRAATAAAAGDSRGLHPISLGAAAVFADGTVATAHQMQALEYGCSVDPVCQLAAELTKRAGVAAVAMADQFGVCHAPFAPARALLVEHGFGACLVAAHGANGELMAPVATELLPGLPSAVEHGLLQQVAPLCAPCT